MIANTARRHPSACGAHHATGFHDHDTLAVLRHCSPVPNAVRTGCPAVRPHRPWFGAPDGGSSLVSRRVGPGGRLRPAPRPHHTSAHVDPARATPLTGSPAPDGALSVASSAVAAGPDDAESLDMTAGPVDPADGAVARPEVVPVDAAIAEAFGSVVQPFAAPDRYALARVPYPGTEADPQSLGGPVEGAPRAGTAAAVADPRAGERRERPGAPPPQRQVERRSFTTRPLGPAQPADDQPRSAPAGTERATPICTAPQLRRFIKSRAYVPMHELRRRFGIEGGDDDVAPVDLESGRIFVGLPAQEGQLLGDLMRAGEVGFELSRDPHTPVVVGVYSMRPIPRP